MNPIILALALVPSILQVAEAPRASSRRLPAAPAVELVQVGVSSTPVSRDWIAKSGDSICGLKEASQVSNPVIIDWQACLDATPEMKKAKSEKIDLSTPEGIKLVNEATNRVTTACETLRSANGYCSVWRAIKHKDGRAVTDISELVKTQF
jgi:hypothetical protein